MNEPSTPQTQNFACTSVCKFPSSAHPTTSKYGGMVKIIVGRNEDSKEFHFHKGLLCWASSYFKAALKEDRFKEGIEGVVRLEEDDPDTIQRFMEWVYNGRILPEGLIPFQDELWEVITTQAMWELYAFAECRGIPLLKNDIIDTVADILARTWDMVPPSAVLQIYRDTPCGDGMRRLLVSFMAYAGYNLGGKLSTSSDGYPSLENIPHELLLDYMVALEERAEKFLPIPARDQWCAIDRCRFHDHPKDQGV
ncbi:hypothetical protein SLS55_000242 [Diplodia seriata]|uniref:BTB domain-containing protein n=1 Tax=Diplodia seriata TaxID=420778 RepID=A0ABR3CW93_9PEZI